MNNRVQVLAFDQDAIPTSTDGVTIGGTVDSANRFNGWSGQASGTANTNAWKFTRYFPKGGQYKVRFIYKKDSNCGKVNIGFDSSATALFNTIDTYNATPAYNNVLEITKEITRGYHDITFAVNGKNASASNYQIETNAIQFDLIQEYTEGLYQDDRPAQINQGSMVLLASHTAAVAENSWTANLAIYDLLTKYSEIVIEADGEANTGAFSLQMTVNGLTNAYYSYGQYNTGAAVTAEKPSDNTTQFTIANSSLISASTSTFSGNVRLYINNTTTTVRLMGISNMMSSNAFVEVLAQFNANAVSNLTQIVIKTSANTWKAGTRFSIYGIKRQ